MKKSILEISILNVILTFFVIGIHLVSEPLTLYQVGSFPSLLFFIIHKFLSFAVPGFIFLSSYKIFNSLANNFFPCFASQNHQYEPNEVFPKKDDNNIKKDNFSYKDFMVVRFKKIFICYIIFASIFYFSFVYTGLAVFDLSEFVKGIFLGTISAHFYFIILIFQFYLLIPIFIKFSKAFKPIISLAIAFVISMIFLFLVSNGSLNINFINNYNDRIFISYLFYWQLGYFIFINRDKINIILTEKFIYFSMIYLLVLIFHTKFSYMQFAMGYNYNLDWFFHVIFCSISIIWFYGLSLFSQKLKDGYILKSAKSFDAISFYVYLSHPLFIYLANELLYRGDITTISYRFILRAGFVLVCTIPFSYFFKKLYENYIIKKLT